MMLQMISFSFFLLVLALTIFALHYARITKNNELYTMFIGFLWFICFVTGNLGYTIDLRISSFVLSIRFSSSVYILIFMAILLVYICEGVKKCRELILVSIASQLVILMAELFLGVFSLSSAGRNADAALVLFNSSFSRLGVSIAATVIDLYFAVFIFQLMINRLKKIPVGAAILLSLLATVALDSLIFVAGTRIEVFFQTLASQLIYKPAIVSLISVPFILYVNWFRRKASLDLNRGSLDIFKKIKTLEDEISIAHQKLREYAATLEIKVEERTRQLQDANERLGLYNKELGLLNEELSEAQRVARIDMEMAINVQTSLLPSGHADRSEWDIAYLYRPMSGVSGDFYDFYEYNGKLRGAGLFDVSGHGISSGLITVLAKSIMSRLFWKMIDARLNDVIAEINRNLQKEAGSASHYLTGVMLRFNRNSVEYVNAGHPDILLKRASGLVLPVRKKGAAWRGSILGYEDVESHFKVLKFSMKSGEFLLLYSDCLIELKNENGGRFNEAGIIESITRAPRGSAQDVIDRIEKDVDAFTGGRRLSDDLTVIIVKKI